MLCGNSDTRNGRWRKSGGSWATARDNSWPCRCRRALTRHRFWQSSRPTTEPIVRKKTGPYPGIPEALAELGQKHPLAIVSNKPDAAVKTLCAQYFPGIYARGESADCPRKPAPDMVFRAMEAIGADSCVYVGDSEVDVVTAKNAGVPCLSVLWGFRDRAEIQAAGGTHFCETPQLLVEKIRLLIR